MIRLTPEARLLVAPSRTYYALARENSLPGVAGWNATLGRVALAAAIAGIATATAATGRISWSLALSGTLCWMPLIALQLLTAAAVIAPLTRRRAGAALALFFHAHAPWSLWLLGASAVAPTVPGLAGPTLILATGVVPLVWTAVLAFAYFREVLDLAPRAAAAATLAHQTLTGAVMIGYIAWAVQLWPRLIALRLP